MVIADFKFVVSCCCLCSKVTMGLSFTVRQRQKTILLQTTDNFNQFAKNENTNETHRHAQQDNGAPHSCGAIKIYRETYLMHKSGCRSVGKLKARDAILFNARYPGQNTRDRGDCETARKAGAADWRVWSTE